MKSNQFEQYLKLVCCSHDKVAYCTSSSVKHVFCQVSCGPNTVPVLIWTLAVSLVLCSGLSAPLNNTKCKLLLESESERSVLRRLEPLTGKK